MAGAGVGFGRLTLASTEAQTAADIAALSGAMAVLSGADPEADAEAAMAPNAIESWSSSADLDEIQVGFYDAVDRSFTEGSLPANAVMARVKSTVNNGIAALLGKPTSLVEKVAYASFAGLRGATPTLPIVIGECHFESDCFDDSCMPHLTQAPNNSDSSAWTGFFEGHSTSVVAKYFPEACGGQGKVQPLKIGDVVQITNGQVVPHLRDVDCMLDLGMSQHIIPIVNCNGNFNGSRTVVGFATIDVDYVTTNGGNKGIYLHGIVRSNAPGALGGANYGTGNIALVPVNVSE